jgi:hypothetical protein
MRDVELDAAAQWRRRKTSFETWWDAEALLLAKEREGWGEHEEWQEHACRKG